MEGDELLQLQKDAAVPGRLTFSVPDGGIFKRRVMKRVGVIVNELEKLGWATGEWQIKGKLRIAVVVVMTKVQPEITV